MSERNRRKALKLLAVGAPMAWTKPVVKSVILPAHASVTTCCVTYINLLPNSGNVVVSSALLCSGSFLISGGGAGPGAWIGSGQVSGSGDFSFEVFTDIGGCCVTVSGNADCCGFEGSFGSTAISGIYPGCE